MIVLSVRNVHDALPQAVALLRKTGEHQETRNGPVLQGPGVVTVYHNPCERVMFWPQRDANPFFHLYESLWMLAGRNDIAPLTRYTKNMANFSDDGVTQHAAYGRRWRHAPVSPGIGFAPEFDQLPVIARTLRDNPDDRRCVLQMWDAPRDLGRTGKDFPCNLTATFQRGSYGELNLTVFCRSNDIIWGAYGANAVHFSFLLEYMALWIGCPVGLYTQVSVNWHGYLDTLNKLTDLPLYGTRGLNPYETGAVYPTLMFHGTIEDVDNRIKALLFAADTGFQHPHSVDDSEPFFNAAYSMLLAHHMWANFLGAERFDMALQVLGRANQRNDWIQAGTQWIERRRKSWQDKTKSVA